MSTEKISIIMPVFNEEKNLRATLNCLNLSGNEELIIVDGGSCDGTVSIAKEFTDKVFSTETGRAHTMNYGAGKATGDMILFLHADCVLPENGYDLIRITLRKNNFSAGAFHLSINASGLRYRLIEAGANLRSLATSIMYGDQGIFMKRTIFDQIGGYAEIPLMEDIDISKKLKKTGKLALISPPIKSSPRRWLKEGALHTTLRDWAIAFSYTFLNISPARLLKYYKDVR